jgi:hypothetical protein
MTVLTAQGRACFETTRRLLAETINEGLASAAVTLCQPTEQRCLVLTSNFENRANPENWAKVCLLPDTYLGLKDGKVISLV